MKLFKDLLAARPEYSREFNLSRTFWSLTLRAHLDAVILRLCKAYDQYRRGKPSLNLCNLLDTIEANLHLFDEPNFRERLKDNPFVDSLAATPRRPHAAELQQDRESVSNSNPLVKKLTIWRNNFYGHRSSYHALDSDSLERQWPLSVTDIEQLLANGVTVVNRYSILFLAEAHSTNMVGRDDYLSLLKAVRESLDAREARIQEEIRRWTLSSAPGHRKVQGGTK
jgi:hypothetical protein